MKSLQSLEEKMKKNLIAVLLVSVTFGITINVPGDYPTIQEAINVSNIGDVVLVADGTYYENLIVNKEITIASHYINDEDLSHRDNTIIDGSNYDENSGPFGSCVLFHPPENGDAISPKLTGFTIQNGSGTRVSELVETPDGNETITYAVGGGFMADHCLPEITYNYFRNNGLDTEEESRAGSTKGGGAGLFNNDGDIEFDDDRSESYPRTALTRDDELILSNNIFENNTAETGHTFESLEFLGTVNFSGSHFDIAHRDDSNQGNNGVPQHWIRGGREMSYNYQDISSELPAFRNNVWISPDGSNEPGSSGTEEDPFRTITYVFSRIYSTENLQISVHLLDGVYSDTTNGEHFPIHMIDWVHIIGTEADFTILDAGGESRIFNFHNNDGSSLSNLTIQNGMELGEGYFHVVGGGILIDNSNPTLNNVSVLNSQAKFGGGLFFKEANPILNNVTVSNNVANNMGGGICFFQLSNATLDGVLINENIANAGGGIYLDHSNPILLNSTIEANSFWDLGGGIYCESSDPILTNVVITNNFPYNDDELLGQSGGGIYLNGSDPIITASVIKDNTADYGAGIRCYFGSSPEITDVIILGNTATFGHGGGIHSSSSLSNPSLTNVTISGNSATHGGGGLYCSNYSNPALNYVTFYNNTVTDNSWYVGGGGLMAHEYAAPVLINVTFSENSSFNGGAIFCRKFANPVLVNSILWNNSPNEIQFCQYSTYDGPNDLIVAYSDVQGGEEGVVTNNNGTLDWLPGNIDADPLFVDPEIGDFSLQPDSPCIDNGASFLEIDGIPFINISPSQFNGFGPDMGAYEFEDDTQSSISVVYNEGWNIAGLPMDIENANYQILFPEAYTGALYSYDGSYQPETILTPGTGYLLRLASGGTTDFLGQLIDELTLSLIEGWNLISGISTPVDANVFYNSGIIATGGIYGYDGSYVSAETIDPGMGYWVRALNDGEITLSSIALATKTVEQVNHLEGSNELEFANGEYSVILYFGKEVAYEHKNSYSLPPTFPQMVFDARFNDDMKYTVESGEISVINTNKDLILNYIVNIHPEEYMEWVLITENGKEYILTGTDEIALNQGATTMTLTKRAIIPQVYTLHQNYPNPFNPITSLRYDLPEKAQVTLTVYNMLGREVAKLVNTTQEAGFKSVQWNATDSFGKSVSAGVYLYQIRSGEFVHTRKMILLK